MAYSLCDIVKNTTLGPYSHTIQVTIYRRLRISQDGHLDQSEAYDISLPKREYLPSDIIVINLPTLPLCLEL